MYSSATICFKDFFCVIPVLILIFKFSY
jgi:hypothetical protein